LQRLRTRAAAAESYDAVFDQVENRVRERMRLLEVENERAPKLYEELTAQPKTDQRRMVRESPRFWTAALADLLLEHCRNLFREDLVRAEEVARLALDLVDRLDPQLYGKGLVNDLTARAWACFGNVLRIATDLRGATTAFANAEANLEDGSGDLLERALVIDLKVSLLRAQRRFEAALEASQQVAKIYKRAGDRHLHGRALISQAMIHSYAGEPEKAIPLLLQSRDMIDPAREPQLDLMIQNNLLFGLVEAGRVEEAEALAPEVVRAAAETSQPERAHCRWNEARLDIVQGRVEVAESKLRAVREEFVEQGHGYNAALVSLDLAKLYLRQGRTAETRRLAVEMHSIFSSRDIHREALATLILFQRAAEQDRCTVHLVEEVIVQLHQVQAGTGVPYERPA